MCRLDREMSPLITSCDFPMHVSTDEALRNASSESDEKLRKFQVSPSSSSPSSSSQPPLFPFSPSPFPAHLPYFSPPASPRPPSD